ncbi:arginine--tRNA ligase [Synechococcus sp. O70.2]|jgi:arginyl-tRNA synthetase|uniref:arginine--tRNA ligase n=1 Tax=unclassified Synechococcus TaxID=2626047 RepID=UPI0039C2B222
MVTQSLSTSLIRFLTAAVAESIQRAAAAGQLGSLTPERAAGVVPVVQIPSDPRYGDYACPTPLGMAKLCRLAPAQIAQTLRKHLDLPDIETEVAGGGYLNFRLGDPFLARRLQELLRLGDDFGKTASPHPERILLEYVSANPTGPLHVGHGRWAAVGSTLANLLRWTGHQVEREFYINDAGNQMRLLGQSLEVRVRQLQGEEVALPEDGYHGSYLIDIARRLLEQVQAGIRPLPASLEEYIEFAYEEILAWQKQTLQQLRTEFDHWFSERRLHTPDPQTGLSAIQQALQELQERGFLYRARAPRGEDPKLGAEEAVYFKTQEFGDDKDRVVQKADGSFTYLAADIAYHRDKVRRGYQRLINILGSDHHGYIGRLRAAVAAFNPEVKLEILIGQFVKLFKADPETGEKVEVRMSKRTGNFVSLNDLIEDPEIGVGVDAARWFLLSSSMDSPINFDLDLAVKQTFDNPVVYVHYSHARCCTLLRRLQEEEKVKLTDEVALTEQRRLPYREPEERALLLRLLALPDELIAAAEERAPHKIIRYAEAVAADFNKFYDNCRILPLLKEDPLLAQARIQLVQATRQVLFNVLTGILGLSAPESM